MMNSVDVVGGSGSVVVVDKLWVMVYDLRRAIC